jgi:hypothetical protein
MDTSSCVRFDPCESAKNKQTSKHVSADSTTTKGKHQQLICGCIDGAKPNFFSRCLPNGNFLKLTPFSDSIAVDSLKRQRPHLMAHKERFVICIRLISRLLWLIFVV